MIFIDRVDITPGSTGVYVDIDVSAYVSGLATGVILHIVNTNASLAYRFAIRKKGGTSDLYYQLLGPQQTWGFTGLDGNKTFQAKVESADVKIYLMGYFEGEAVFFDDPVDKSFSSGSWMDIDISADTGTDTAIGAIFESHLGSGYKEIGFRMKGSTDDRHSDFSSHAFSIIGVDANEVCQGFQEGRVQTFLVGYLKAGAQFNMNAEDYSLGSTGSWQDLTQLPAGAIGAIIEVNNSGGIRSDSYGLRKNGSLDDIVTQGQHCTAVIACDENRLVEGYIGNTRVDFWLVGYVEESGPIVYTEDLGIICQQSEIISDDQYGPPVYCVVKAVDVVDMRGVGFTLIWDTLIAGAWLQNGVPKAVKGEFLNGGDPSKDDLLIVYNGPGNIYASLVLLGEEEGVSGSGKLFYVQFERLQSGDPDFNAIEIELEAQSGSIVLEYSDYVPVLKEEYLGITLLAIFTEADKVTYNESLLITCNSPVSITDKQKYVDGLLPILARVEAILGDAQVYVEDILITELVAVTILDKGNYVESVKVSIGCAVYIFDTIVGVPQEFLDVLIASVINELDAQVYADDLQFTTSCLILIQDEVIGTYLELLDILQTSGIVVNDIQTYFDELSVIENISIDITDDLITPGIPREDLNLILVSSCLINELQPIQSDNIGVMLNAVIYINAIYNQIPTSKVFRIFEYKKKQLTFYPKVKLGG